MSKINAKIAALGLVLPQPMITPDGMKLPFPWVSVRGDRVFVSGHGPLNADGTVSGPFGKVGRDVTIDQAYDLAAKTGLAILTSLRDELGDLDRITGWCRIFGMVNSAPDFNRQPAVINGFTDLINKIFDTECARHTRSAVGMAALPFDIAVEIEAEVMIAA